MATIPSSFSRAFTGALVLVIIVLSGVLWFYNHKLENQALLLAQKEQENVMLREPEARLKDSWALEVRLNKALMEKQQNVDDALTKVDADWGNTTVHESVLGVLKAAGICISGPSASPFTGSNPKAPAGNDGTPNK